MSYFTRRKWDSEILWSSQFMNPICRKQYYLYHFCTLCGRPCYYEKKYNYLLSHRDVGGKKSHEILCPVMVTINSLVTVFIYISLSTYQSFIINRSIVQQSVFITDNQLFLSLSHAYLPTNKPVHIFLHVHLCMYDIHIQFHQYSEEQSRV